MLGETIGPYRVEREIGLGFLGVVYAGRKSEADPPVAIKVYESSLIGDSAFYLRLDRNMPILVRLSHPNILPVIDWGVTHRGEPFVVMPFVEGVSLAALLSDHTPMQPETAVGILRQVAAGLDDLHRHYVVHRDLRPGNILRAGDTWLISDCCETLRVYLSIVLTGPWRDPSYEAPEVIMGDAAVTQAVDIHALAVIAFQMLSGSLPYQGEIMMATLLQIATEPVPDIRARQPGLAEETALVLLKGMAKQPAERYAGAGEFVSALAASFGLP